MANNTIIPISISQLASLLNQRVAPACRWMTDGHPVNAKLLKQVMSRLPEYVLANTGRLIITDADVRCLAAVARQGGSGTETNGQQRAENR